MAFGPAEAGFLVAVLFVALLGIAVLVMGIITVVEAYRAGREGWWLYLIALFISPLNLVAVIAWFAYLKHNPVMNDGKPFL